MMRMFRAALGTNNIDHMYAAVPFHVGGRDAARAQHLGGVGLRMREVEHAADVIFIAGANNHPSRTPVFGRRHTSRLGPLAWGGTKPSIVADPRRTEPIAGRAGTFHLQMQPGTDVALFNAMLHHIIAAGTREQGVRGRAGCTTSTRCGSPSRR